MDKRKQPKLRFPEFSEEWKEYRLEHLFEEFKSGKGITTDRITNSGEFPVYGGNGLRGYTNKYTHEGKYFLIGRQGALCGNINRFEGKAYVSEHAIACKGNIDSNTEWLAQRLDYYNLNRLSESSAQPGLSVKKLLRFKLTIPSLPEQEKIALFLSSVDEKIQKLWDKEDNLREYKKGITQKIFSQNIRFKGDNDEKYPDWKERKLGEIFEHRSERGFENLELLSVTMNDGIKRRSEINGKDNSSQDKSNYKRVYKNDVVYNSMRMWQGASGVSSYDGIVSPAYTVLKGNNLNSSAYFGYLFKTTKMTNIFQSNSQGLTSDTWNLKYPQLSTIKINLPCLKEQEKIVDFISTIDKKIEVINTEIDEMKKFKNGLLQQMFV